MRSALWPNEDRATLGREIAGLSARGDFAAFGAVVAAGQWIGLIEVGARDVAEGCETSPVGYVEALWVEASARRTGVARRLVEAAIAWSRQHGYRELASDTEIGNTIRQDVHRRLGFSETDRIVCFRMSLG